MQLEFHRHLFEQFRMDLRQQKKQPDAKILILIQNNILNLKDFDSISTFQSIYSP
jgi:hypothetical protein